MFVHSTETLTLLVVAHCSVATGDRRQRARFRPENSVCHRVSSLALSSATQGQCPGACVDVSSLTYSSCWRSHTLREALRPLLCLPNSLFNPPAGCGANPPPAGGGELFLPREVEVSSVTATLFFSCVPDRTLATDTCSCGLVQVFPFSRCVVRVLALGSTQQGPPGSVPSSRGCELQVPLGIGRRRGATRPQT